MVSTGFLALNVSFQLLKRGLRFARGLELAYISELTWSKEYSGTQRKWHVFSYLPTEQGEQERPHGTACGEFQLRLWLVIGQISAAQNYLHNLRNAGIGAIRALHTDHVQCSPTLLFRGLDLGSSP